MLEAVQSHGVMGEVGLWLNQQPLRIPPFFAGDPLRRNGTIAKDNDVRFDSLETGRFDRAYRSSRADNGPCGLRSSSRSSERRRTFRRLLPADIITLKHLAQARLLVSSDCFRHSNTKNPNIQQSGQVGYIFTQHPPRVIPFLSYLG